MNYRAEIDGLRAIAVLPVIMYHGGIPGFTGGYVGVDVFFVISGFLITSLIVPEMLAGEFSILKFYERRARRLVPALVLVVVACVPFAYLWMLPFEFRDFGQSIVAVTFFYSNIHFFQEIGYFDPFADFKPLLHTWSLAVEEQFYLFYPICLILLGRWWGKKSFLPFLIIVSVVSLATAEVLWRINREANYLLYPSRAWELGIGAMLALVLPAGRPVRHRLADVFSIIGMAGIAAAVFLFDDFTPFPGLLALIPVGGTALVIAFCSPETFVGRLLSWKPVVGIGLISYSAYLWHQPLFVFSRMRFGEDLGLGWMFVLSAVALLAGYLSWRYVERPFRIKGKFSRKQIFGGTIAAGAAMVALGLFAIGSVHMHYPFRGILEANEYRIKGNYGLSSACDLKDGFDVPESCRTTENPEVALWGDSFAMHLGSGLATAVGDRGLVQITKSACGAVPGVVPMHSSERRAAICFSLNNDAEDYFAESPTIKDVVISTRFDLHTSGNFTFYTANGKIPTDTDLAMELFMAMHDRLTKAGKRVTVISSPPRNGTAAAICALRNITFGRDPNDCNFTRKSFEDHDANDLHERAFLHELVRRGVRVVFLEDYLCDKEMCHVMQGDTLMYKDGFHISYEGSDWIEANTPVFDFVRNR